MKRIEACGGLALLMLLGSGSLDAFAQSGGTFAVTQSVTGSGDVQSSGGVFTFQGTLGQSTAGTTSTGSSFVSTWGFWAPSTAAAAPVVIAPTSAGVAANTATLGGTVSSDGGSAITERGVVYAVTSTNSDPLIGSSGVVKVMVAGTTGVFTAGVSGLAASTGYSFKAYAINAVGTTYTTPVATFTTSVPACPAITLGALANGLVGVAYTGSSAASGGTGPYTYAVTSGALPSSVSLTLSGAGAGNVAGTPEATGTYNFQITATDTAAPGTCTGAMSYTVVVGDAIAAGDLVIREFRARGPASTTDEYIEIANVTSGPRTIAAIDGSAGFGIAAQNAGPCPAGSTQLLATIPNGTVIPMGGAFLAVNSTGYSLTNYGGAAAAAPNVTWSLDVCDGSGLGLFQSSTTLGAGTVLDAVGFAAGSSSPYLEGTGLLTPAGVISASGQHAFVRKSPYPLGAVKDTGDNGADFYFVSIDGGIYSGVQSALGTPGPQNLASAVSSALPTGLADPGMGANVAPNRVQSGNYYYFRRLITNNTDAPITKLRFRIADITTFFGDGYNPGVQADWRGIDTSDVVIALTDTTTPTAKGLALEAPTVAYSVTGKGAGFNAGLTLNLGGPLPKASSIYVNIGIRNVKAGAFYFVLVPEILN